LISDTPKGVNYIYEPPYSKNISFRRIFSHSIFAWNVLKRIIKSKENYDVVYVGFPTPMAFLAAILIAKRLNARLIVDIQDLWPEAFILALPKKIRFISGIIFSPFILINKFCFSKIDCAIAVSETYIQTYRNFFKKSVPVHVCFLGTSLDKFDDGKPSFSLARNYDLNLCYVGKLSHSYDISSAIKAVRALPLNIDVGFHIFGTGPQKSIFQEEAQDCLNIHFYDNLSYDVLPTALRACDVGLNVIVKDAAQSITNKHADYAAGGLAVINTQENAEYRNIVTDFHFGFNVTVEDWLDLKGKVLQLYNDRKLLFEMKQNSRKFAQLYMNRDNTYPKLMEFILQNDKRS
jgi:glycosyltransferase involved in cell wall biosynthesis